MAAARSSSSTAKTGKAPAGQTAKGMGRARVRVAWANGEEQTVTIGGLRMVIEVERRFGKWEQRIEHMAWAVFVALGKPGELEVGDEQAFDAFLDNVVSIEPLDDDAARPTTATRGQ